MRTTSASSLSAMLRAADAPTLPDPTTVILRFMAARLREKVAGGGRGARDGGPGRGGPTPPGPGTAVYMLPMMASANCDVFNSVAPCISRARS